MSCHRCRFTGQHGLLRLQREFQRCGLNAAARALGAVRLNGESLRRCAQRVLCALGPVLLAACSGWWRPYHIEVQQGNYLDQAAVAKLQRGMTPDQVKFLLGSPLVTDTFHSDRWDYVYRRQRASEGSVDERRLTVYFKDKVLDHVDGDVVAAGAQARNQADNR